jgi:Probable zinc-ribbon domain
MGVGKRGARDGKQRRLKQPKVAPADRIITLPVVGPVALIRNATDTAWVWDLNYKPPLPMGALRGNPGRQIFCCDAPRYAYVDEPRTCVQCGAEFVFSAKEQKHWYEVLQFRLDSHAIRCLPCRRQRRSERAVQRRLDAVMKFRDSDDAGEVIEFVSALCEFIERTGNGKAATAVAAARRARRLQPEWTDPLYWEARAHACNDQPDKARLIYQQFLDEAAASKQVTKRHVTDAKAWLSTHPQ